MSSDATVHPDHSSGAPDPGPAQTSTSGRSALLPAGYNPLHHIASTLILTSLIAGSSAWMARSASAWDFVLIPSFFLFANAFEWAIHRGPMHRPLQPRILYKNHALVHHRAFTQDTMEIGRPVELGLIMMPWYTLLLLFVMASPVAVLAGWLRGAGAAGVFYLSATGYFLLYEGLHASYHLPEAWRRKVGLTGNWFNQIRAHHTHHHRMDRMAHVNFNVTFPLTDLVMGTRERPFQQASKTSSEPKPAS